MLYCLSTRFFVVWWSWFDDAQSFRLKKRCWFDHELKVIIDKEEEEEKKNEKKNEADLMTLKTFDWRRDADLIMNSELLLTKKCWSDHELKIIIDEKKEEEKRWNSWSIKLSIEDSFECWNAFVLSVFIQYIKFIVVVSSYSLLNTSIENQTSRSISFYSWKRQFNIDKNIKLARALTEILV